MSLKSIIQSKRFLIWGNRILLNLNRINQIIENMRKIDIKSIVIGMFVAAMSFSLLSSSPEEEKSTLTLSGHPSGIFIFNSNTNQLFKYDIIMGSLSTSPRQTYVVSPDGSKLHK